MGSLIKLVGIVGTLIVSYAILYVLVVDIGLLPVYLGQDRAPPNPYSVLLDYALAVVSSVVVATFFTIPVTLLVFGGAGRWVKHVAVRSTRWLFGAFGAVVLLYLGAGALSPIEEGVSIGPLLVLLVSGVLVIGLISGRTLVRGAESVFTLAPRLPLPAKGESRAAVELRMTPIHQIREKRDERLAQEEGVKFQRLVVNLALLRCVVAFRLSF